MDNELIKIEERNGVSAVNARELHKVLDSKQEFANWIKNRIEKYGFVENQDYEVIDNFIKNPQGGRPTKEYALSLDMAKELAMVENNDNGRRVRLYFIEKEKEAHSLPSYQIADPIKRAKKWIEEQERLQLLEKQNQEVTEKLAIADNTIEEKNKVIEAKDEERARLQVLNDEQHKKIGEQKGEIRALKSQVQTMEAKSSYVDKIFACKSTLTATQIAQDYGMVARAFNQVLSKLRIQYKVKKQWILYAPYVNKGYVQSQAVEIVKSNGTRELKYNTEWTQKGRFFLYETLKKHNILPTDEM